MYCATYDDGSWECFYDDGSSQYTDAGGNTNYIDSSGAGVDWASVIDAGTQAAIAILNRNGYQQSGYRPPTQTYNGPIPGVTASAGANRGSVGGSLNISTNTLLIIGVVVFAFVFGKGRR